MQTNKDLQKHRQMIEAAVVELGRDDVGIGDVSEAQEGILSVTFSRGTLAHTADVPVEKLQDKDKAKQAVRSAMLGLSKALAEEAIQKA